ncbi:MAG: imidazolonepropionase [Bacteroidetes bacterium]|nr:imidazolonepropionase [Bacteroidota bacterium]
MYCLYYNIGLLGGLHQLNAPLRGADLANFPHISNAYLITQDDKIVEYGSMQDLTTEKYSFTQRVDAKNGALLPSWCDSHTHVVFAGSRENEFVDKIKGLSYASIAAKGGGILNSAIKLQQADEQELYELALERIRELAQAGTGAIEIKSGYGLTLDAELKMLRVIKRLKENTPLLIRATFLGAHAFPTAYKNNPEGYIELLLTEMIPAVAKEELAQYIDVFCEEGFFSPAQTTKICEAGLKFGLRPRLHANQLAVSGGVQVGVSLNAISVDHLESMDEEAIQALSNSTTIGTLLPNASFFLRMQDAPARQLIEAGAIIALASDYNPGSAPSGNMNGVIAQACIRMRMLPEEAFNAATLNGACAMELENLCGSIQVGKLANFFITKPIPSLAYYPYAFGSNLISKIVLQGKEVNHSSF